MQKLFVISLKISAALTALASLGTGAAFAQAPPPPPPPAQHGFLHNMFHHPKPGQGPPPRPMPGRPMPGRPMPGRPGYHPMGGSMMGMGNIVGNKNTRVYHMAGDRGALPAPQNRVYFRSEHAAMAAGFRRAGSPHGMHIMGNHTMTNHAMGNHMMQGSPRTGTPGMMTR